MIWGRHQSDRKYHVVVEIQPRGSMISACAGRWYVDEGELYSADGCPSIEERCQACVRHISAPRLTS